jgi:hypothetical protein
LAEKAVQLYRDTDYGDLISFEEDIARIAAVVVVIPESAGSLAELGAFAANETIRSVLRVVIQHKYDIEESFVRYGPVERMKRMKRDYLGVYPWRVRPNGTLVISSAQPHFKEIKNFIDGHADATPVSVMFSQIQDGQLFYLVYWVIYLSLAVETKILIQLIQLIEPKATEKEINNKIYCMKIAGWIERFSYSQKDFIYSLHDIDPFDYSFKPGVSDRDSVRRKLAVSAALKTLSNVPKHVLATAAKARIPVRP